MKPPVSCITSRLSAAHCGRARSGKGRGGRAQSGADMWGRYGVQVGISPLEMVLFYKFGKLPKLVQ